MRKQRASTLSFALSITSTSRISSKDGFGIIASLAPSLACVLRPRKSIFLLALTSRSASVSHVLQYILRPGCGASLPLHTVHRELVPCACTKITWSPHPSCLVLYELSQSVKRPRIHSPPESGSLAVSLSVHLSYSRKVLHYDPKA